MSSIELGKLNVGIDTLEQVAGGLEIPAWELLRIAEVGAGSAETPRAGGARRRGAPYSGESSKSPKSPSDTAARRKVAEDRDR